MIFYELSFCVPILKIVRKPGIPDAHISKLWAALPCVDKVLCVFSSDYESVTNLPCISARTSILDTLLKSGIDILLLAFFPINYYYSLVKISFNIYCGAEIFISCLITFELGAII